jgi:hypothetical protein
MRARGTGILTGKLLDRTSNKFGVTLGQTIVGDPEDRIYYEAKKHCGECILGIQSQVVASSHL